MNRIDTVAVCSRSFSKNLILREELLTKYEKVTFNDDGLKLEGETLVSFLEGHTKAITALEKIDSKLLEKLPDLKMIGKYGVGLDMIDFEAMRTNQVRLGWTGGVNKRAVSEMVISLAISLLRCLSTAHREVLNGTWKQHMGRHLSTQTVGIVGCGNIGKDLVKLLKPFGCKVLVNDIRNYEQFYAENDIEATELDDLLSRADVVTLHVPLDHSTENILSEDRLALLKKGAILINVARGSLVDEQCLKKLLKSNQIAAAALDVFSVEPPEDGELLQMPNFIVTPHLGGSSHEAILAMGRAAIMGLDDNEIPGEAFGI